MVERVASTPRPCAAIGGTLPGRGSLCPARTPAPRAPVRLVSGHCCLDSVARSLDRRGHRNPKHHHAVLLASQVDLRQRRHEVERHRLHLHRSHTALLLGRRLLLLLDRHDRSDLIACDVLPVDLALAVDRLRYQCE